LITQHILAYFALPVCYVIAVKAVANFTLILTVSYTVYSTTLES